MTPLGPPPPVVSSGPSVGPINIESSREDLVQSSERETADPSVTNGNKKKRSAPNSSASIDAQARTGSDEPPRKKKKKEKKVRKKSAEGQSEPIGDAEGHEPVVHEGSSRDATTRAVVESSGSPNIPLEKRKKLSCGSDVSASAAKTPSVAPPTITGGGSASEERRIKFRDGVEFKYDGDTPLAYAPSKCSELIRQIRGGAKDMPPVKDLLFKDAYVDAGRTKVLSDGSMNYVVELYDTALKETISKLKQSDRLVRATDTVINRKTSEFRAAIDKAAAEQSRLLTGKKAQKEKSNEPTGRELGESSVQGHEVVSRVERSEDATAPLVLDPASSMANLVVIEESLIPILRVSDANPSPPLGLEEAGLEPVDLLELSDSSAEEEGGEKSDERVPGDNPQGTEEGVVDEVENLSASTTDEAGGASDQLQARVVEEDPDRAEN
ncbi:hypothetical protein F2Q69_00036649 [Brassica cretica]|uniref:Uncharacterized protein n=1 Tax=Brassica cretica TaxID=69181 RepID=A0A8S9SJR7_BRACR|nr:hypothetical protein F2Q69_00036649 [Brassica cretica]